MTLINLNHVTIWHFIFYFSLKYLLCHSLFLFQGVWGGWVEDIGNYLFTDSNLQATQFRPL